MKEITVYKLLDGTIVEDLSEALKYKSVEIARKAFIELYKMYTLKYNFKHYTTYEDLMKSNKTDVFYALIINHTKDFIKIYYEIIEAAC